jgi:hypothetical protein
MSKMESFLTEFGKARGNEGAARQIFAQLGALISAAVAAQGAATKAEEAPVPKGAPPEGGTSPGTEAAGYEGVPLGKSKEETDLDKMDEDEWDAFCKDNSDADWSDETKSAAKTAWKHASRKRRCTAQRAV